jgi:hypothetical protein
MKNLYLEEGVIYYSLTRKDIIEENDYVRFPNDANTSPFKPENYKSTAFHYAKDDIPAWVGKTKEDILQKVQFEWMIEILRPVK